VIVHTRALGHLCACLLLIGGAAFPVQATENTAQLPGDGFLGVWQPVGPPRVFNGAQLYDYIDGGAEIFYELGFERVTVQRYRADADEIAVELYAMRDPVAALGVYLAKCGQETPASGFADRHTAGRHQLMLARDRYFLVVDNLSGKASRAAALVDCAREIVRSLPETALPAVFAALPKTGLVDGSERVIRGPLPCRASSFWARETSSDSVGQSPRWRLVTPVERSAREPSSSCPTWTVRQPLAPWRTSRRTLTPRSNRWRNVRADLCSPITRARTAS